MVTPVAEKYSKSKEAAAMKKTPASMRGVFTPMGYVNPATGENFSAQTPATGLYDQIGPVNTKNQGRFTIYGFNPNAPAVQKGEQLYGASPLTPRTPGDVVPVITGLTPGGEVDRTQSDEYKSIRAQYDALRKRGESAMTPEGMREKALDYGLTEWAKLHPTLAARQQAGSFNPLMQSTFGYQTGEAPDQVQRSMVIGGQRYDVDPEAIQYQIDQQQTQDMNTGNPLMQSAMQQQRTADQAAEATTTGMNRPVGDRVEEFLKRGSSKESAMFPTERLF